MQVTRRRRPVGNSHGLPEGQQGLRSFTKAGRIGVASIALVLTGATIGSASTQQFGTQQVAQLTDKGQVLPSDQYINPIGNRLVINQGKLMGSAVSPDGTHVPSARTAPTWPPRSPTAAPRWSSSTCAATRSSRSSAAVRRRT